VSGINLGVDLGVLALTFVLILPAELPDKTFIATLVLGTRYRRTPVWIGVLAAFAVQCAIAVTAGGLLTLLPQRLVLGVTAALFAAGAVLMIVSGLRARPDESDDAPDPTPDTTSGRRIALISFAVLFTAEWGDLSQILTAGVAARTGAPVSVFLGAWLALAVVAGVAVLAGQWLQSRVALWRVRLLSGVVLSGLAIWTTVEWFQAS
jgi:putative Ca2+/H+ antiporter (TMEM165/GDT1 family)